MRPRELRELSDDELKRKRKDLEEELFNLRFQLSIGQLENTARIKLVKKDIARIETILREREKKR